MDIEDNMVDNFSSDKEDEEDINDNIIQNSLFNNVYKKKITTKIIFIIN